MLLKLLLVTIKFTMLSSTWWRENIRDHHHTHLGHTMELIFETVVGAMDSIPTRTQVRTTTKWTTPLSIRSATAADLFGSQIERWPSVPDSAKRQLSQEGLDLQYHYDDETTKPRVPSLEELDFEPVVNPIKRPLVNIPGVNCEDFTNYAMNCTRDSAVMYNSTKKSPPMPAKMLDWCTAIRHLTNCAIDWNSECKDVTESHFNEESIKGHMHVINHICDDDWFLSHYDDVPVCIDKVAKSWETCYVAFKSVVDVEKNTTHEWSHYLTHFYLCCARTRFRYCTLKALFLEEESKCQHDDAVILQKFSVIVSEGDVFQDCDTAMLYTSCPNGDPRPPTELLYKLMNGETPKSTLRAKDFSASESCSVSLVLLIVICLVNFVL